MFEGSLVESRGLVASETRKWTTMGSLTVQCALAGLLVAIPLLRPQVLRIPAVSAPVAAPFLRRPVVTVRPVHALAATTVMSLPAEAPAPLPATGLTIWPHPGVSEEGDAPPVAIGPGMGAGPGGGADIALGVGDGPAVAVVPEKRSGPVTISSGVTAGMLLEPIRPVYPAIAREARVQGAVVMQAVISKAGRIESLHAVSGPPMLQNAALDAVRTARYRPYLLNGLPTEVETTITVVFTLGG